jgi:tRNA uridine 5-carbamoylmethylation protein Kti12
MSESRLNSKENNSPDDNQKLAIILRGLPGSGKSHWVDTYLKSQGLDIATRVKQYGYFSTDSLFMVDGQYQFDVSKLSQYHQRNLCGFIQALGANEPLVICDNTNVCHWEYAAYQAAAIALDYRVKVVLIGEPKDSQHQQVCAERNRHGVSFAQIQKMAKQFEL